MRGEGILISQIHIIATYMCTMSCEHCFVCGSPSSEGTFTPSQVLSLLDQTDTLRTVDTIYFEGGEPFLFYPVLLDGIRQARIRGYAVGIVTNGYFATSDENARCFLWPIRDLGIADLSISDDIFHYENRKDNAAVRAFRAAQAMGLPAMVLALDPAGSGPEMKAASPREGKIGVISGGSLMFRGRAAAKLSRYADKRDWREFTPCPYEDLKNPSRLHVDAYGNLQICQGISIGNVWERPLAELVRDYSPATHPICGPLIEGGPAQLAGDLRYNPPDTVADACHLCWLARESCRERYPGILEPAQVYCGE